MNTEEKRTNSNKLSREFYSKNKQKYYDKQKKYQKEHVEEIKIKRHEYYEKIKEDKKEYNKAAKKRHEQYLLDSPRLFREYIIELLDDVSKVESIIEPEVIEKVEPIDWCEKYIKVKDVVEVKKKKSRLQNRQYQIDENTKRDAPKFRKYIKDLLDNADKPDVTFITKEYNKKKQKSWRENNLEKYRKYQREYKRKPEILVKLSEKARQYQRDNKEKINAYQRERYRKMKEQNGKKEIK
jgi:hypothetical protein